MTDKEKNLEANIAEVKTEIDFLKNECNRLEGHILFYKICMFIICMSVLIKSFWF